MYKCEMERSLRPRAASPLRGKRYLQNGGLRRHSRHGVQVQMHTSHGGSEAQTATRAAEREPRAAGEQQQRQREHTRREKLASPQRHC